MEAASGSKIKANQPFTKINFNPHKSSENRWNIIGLGHEKVILGNGRDYFFPFLSLLGKFGAIHKASWDHSSFNRIQTHSFKTQFLCE